jgi:lipoprotein
MKNKLPMFMSVMACAALALSGCGNSVSDDRAQAYASLSSMTNLEQDQVKDYKQRLTVAPDSAAIKSVLADAKAANDKVASDNAKADKGVKEVEAAITGVKLVGTGDCADVTLVLNADKTWQISGENADQCFLSHDLKYWTVARYPDSGIPYFIQSDTKDDIYGRTVSEIRLSEDKRTVKFVHGTDFYEFTITK